MGHCLYNTDMDMIIHIHIRLTDTNNSIVQCNNKSILSVIAALICLDLIYSAEVVLFSLIRLTTATTYPHLRAQ